MSNRLQHIYHGQPYARVDLLTLCRSRLYPQIRDFRLSPCVFSCFLTILQLFISDYGNNTFDLDHTRQMKHCLKAEFREMYLIKKIEKDFELRTYQQTARKSLV